MICVECSEPTDSLYEKYKGNHIRLTVCDKCHNVADKYIEYDNTLLFIDLMLLKPQAYRHTIYNQMIIDRAAEKPYDLHWEANATEKKPETKSNFLETYGYVIRLSILLLLFEVYVKWAYEEKNYLEGTGGTTMIMKRVLDGPLKYLFFLTTTLVENVVLTLSISFLARKLLHFGQGSFNASRELGIISTTVLLSSIIKLFPIVMLIWPYDNLILNMTRILVGMVHLAILVEALHIILLNNPNNAYWKIWITVMCSFMIKGSVTKLLVSSVYSYWFGVPFGELLDDEMAQTHLKLRMIGELAGKVM